MGDEDVKWEKLEVIWIGSEVRLMLYDLDCGRGWGWQKLAYQMWSNQLSCQFLTWEF
jgi:hypothetical protein